MQRVQTMAAVHAALPNESRPRRRAFLAACLLGLVAGRPVDAARPDATAAAEGEVLVRFRDDASAQSKASAHAAARAIVVRRFHAVKNLELVRVPSAKAVGPLIAQYRARPDVLYAEPNYRLEAFGMPNDPMFGELWGMNNTGQRGGVPDADIDLPEARDLSTGSANVVVAIIDTGIDYRHPDLARNVFVNAADCDGDGVDDDGNGYVDDCHGIDTVNGDSDPFDDAGHGTHVAGTIGAVGDNAVGVTGVNSAVTLMACKFLGADGSGWVDGAVACLDYVSTMRDRGVNIVATNNSWGGGGPSQALADAIESNLQRGVLFIAAAGNWTSDNDSVTAFPSGIDLPNVIAVAATTRTDELAFFSSYGHHSVHVGAPGHEILSTLPGGTYGEYSGTSMATPHVTGVAALLKAYRPSLDWRGIKNLILTGGDDVAAMAGVSMTGKRLNARGSLTCSGRVLLARRQPQTDRVAGTPGTPIVLSAHHVSCAAPNGDVTVTVDPSGETVVLHDDGAGPDRVAGDGLYTAEWTPWAYGNYTLTFPNADVVTVTVAQNYEYSMAPFVWRTIAGTSLELSDDSAVQVALPFPVEFGGGTFNDVFVASNGFLSFGSAYAGYAEVPLPMFDPPTFAVPYWDDLYPIPGTAENVFVDVAGTAPHREFVVEWRDVAHYGCPGSAVLFQAVLFEGRPGVLFNYADTSFGSGCELADRGASATVGVQIDPERATQFSYDTPSLADGTAILFHPGCERPTDGTVKLRARGDAGAMVAKLTLPVSTYAGDDVTVALEDGDSHPIVSDTVTPAASGASGRYWRYASPTAGLRAVSLKGMADGSVVLKAKSKQWFSAAAANDDAAHTRLEVSIGGRCFSQEVTKKID
jgi:serine protease